MELNEFSIIKRTLFTPKAAKLRESLGTITFLVDRAANKISVKKAVESIWNVKVDTVRIINVKGKSRRFGRLAFG
jgi:large subunit ribosomal protein L23